MFIEKDTEEKLRKEANLTDAPESLPNESDVSSVLAAYKSEGDPEIYCTAYLELRKFVEESLDIYKVNYIILTPFGLKITVLCHFSMNWVLFYIQSLFICISNLFTTITKVKQFL